jgi:hypothetical protein
MKPNPCCNDEANLSPPAQHYNAEGKPVEKMTAQVCAVCGCRHLHLELEAGQIGLKMTND